MYHFYWKCNTILCNHPNIIAIYGFYENNLNFFIVEDTRRFMIIYDKQFKKFMYGRNYIYYC